MNDDDDLSFLSTYLSELRIEQQQLTQKIARVEAQVKRRKRVASQGRPNHTIEGEEQSVADHGEGKSDPVAVAERVTSAPVSQSTREAYNPQFPRAFRAGDRVRINNAVKRPKSWPIDSAWTAERERRAVVRYTNSAGDQVHILTENGHETWRKPYNLTFIE